MLQRLSYCWRRYKLGCIGAVVLCAIVWVAIFAPLLAPYSPDTQFANGLTDDGSPLAPCARYLLGTDLLGRDLLSRLIYGARTSLVIGIVANGVAVIIGTVL